MPITKDNRPAFDVAWNNFTKINVSVAEVGKIIGGKVQANIDAKTFTNGCAIRMSYTLNYSGIPIIRNNNWSTVSGADKYWYIFRVRELINYLNYIFGKPDDELTNPKADHFSNKKGIIVFDVPSWSDATGHATLWNGVICSDSCYFDKANKVYLWQLK